MHRPCSGLMMRCGAGVPPLTLNVAVPSVIWTVSDAQYGTALALVVTRRRSQCLLDAYSGPSRWQTSPSPTWWWGATGAFCQEEGSIRPKIGAPIPS